MAQVGYFTNANVNEWFNYKTTFIKNNSIKNSSLIKDNSVIKNVSFSFNSNEANEVEEMSNYEKLIPFQNFRLAKKLQGFGIKTYALYPNKEQPSGTFNMSSITSFSINTTFNTIDDNYTNYIFKTYGISYNNLVIMHGVAGVMFNNNI